MQPADAAEVQRQRQRERESRLQPRTPTPTPGHTDHKHKHTHTAHRISHVTASHSHTAHVSAAAASPPGASRRVAIEAEMWGLTAAVTAVLVAVAVVQWRE